MDFRGLVFLLALSFMDVALAGPERFCYYNQKIPSMGSFIEIQLSTGCRRAIKKNLALQIKNQLDLWEAEFSLYQPRSALSQLNAHAELANPSATMLQLIASAKFHSVKTGGSFDVTVGAVLARIEDAFQKTYRPPKNLASTKVGARYIEISKDKIRFAHSGMRVSLDGMVKGFAVDKISDYLMQNNHPNFLVNFSGNMRWNGHRAENQRWKIYRWNPLTKSTLPVAAKISGAIATSGNEHQYFDTTKKWHHLINARTSRPANYWLSTTVTGPSAMICDILSTATFVSARPSIEGFFAKNYSDYQYFAVSSSR